MSEPRTRDEAVVKIACVQMEPVVGQKERNVRRTLEFIEQAAANGAHLVVLPELCNSGYVFESRQEAFSLAEEIPNGPTCHAWKDIARQRGLHIVAGIDERDGQALYNAAVLIGPSGHVGTFRKLHLWNEENLFFEPGNLGFPVFRTPLGRIATFICYDGWFPESYRLCALQGADVAKRAGIPVYTVALGTKGGKVTNFNFGGGSFNGSFFGGQGLRQALEPDPATLRAIASRTGGRFYQAQSAGAAEAAYAPTRGR